MEMKDIDCLYNASFMMILALLTSFKNRLIHLLMHINHMNGHPNVLGHCVALCYAHTTYM